MPFAWMLARLIRFGELVVIDADGRQRRFGGPEIPGLPPVTIRLHDRRLYRQLALNPSLAAGEAYAEGRLTVERGTLFDFLAVAGYNLQQAGKRRNGPHPLWRLARLLHQHNPAERASRNVAHHYDLSDRLYQQYLDADRQYSCAYFSQPGLSLEQAQQAKKRHIAAKLLLEPGQRLLDIGSGWGGLALTLARLADIEVLGITLSREQLEVSRQRAAAAGLTDRVRFELLDYRHVGGVYDRIVSVGMFEHVGINQYDRFFARLRELMPEPGVALVHFIGRTDGPGVTNPWIRKYIFPGGYSPALSEVLPAVEDSGLIVTDVEVLRGHYADTLAEWRRRFQANRAEVARLYDERFCRMWEFYLAGSEMSFRQQAQVVFQLQLANSMEAVPRTRDYMIDTERRLTADGKARAAE
jgi:cyclopropane-fatty-acyl-phospholipid synthase